MELHGMIFKAAKNRILPVFMRTINKIGLMSRRRTGEHLEVRRQTVKDHRAIVEALRSRDPEKARRAMMAHLQNVEKKMGEVAGPAKRRR
jgi:DNA-binding FadR family transcriptional regulator